jgi:hypothetical protein
MSEDGPIPGPASGSITRSRRGGLSMRKGYEGIVVSGIMLVVAFVLIAVARLVL